MGAQPWIVCVRSWDSCVYSSLEVDDLSPHDPLCHWSLCNRIRNNPYPFNIQCLEDWDQSVNHGHRPESLIAFRLFLTRWQECVTCFRNISHYSLLPMNYLLICKYWRRLLLAFQLLFQIYGCNICALFMNFSGYSLPIFSTGVRPFPRFGSNNDRIR